VRLCESLQNSLAVFPVSFLKLACYFSNIAPVILNKNWTKHCVQLMVRIGTGEVGSPGPRNNYRGPGNLPKRNLFRNRASCDNIGPCKLIVARSEVQSQRLPKKKGPRQTIHIPRSKFIKSTLSLFLTFSIPERHGCEHLETNIVSIFKEFVQNSFVSFLTAELDFFHALYARLVLEATTKRASFYVSAVSPRLVFNSPRAVNPPVYFNLQRFSSHLLRICDLEPAKSQISLVSFMCY
jgi:hypothetical protein